MTRVTDLHNQWMQDEEYRDEYSQLEAEFAPTEMPVEAKSTLGMSHSEDRQDNPLRNKR